MGITVRQAAAELGYPRFVARFDYYDSDDCLQSGDVPLDTVLVEKTNELPGNRAWFKTEDGRCVRIANLFTLK